jgi:hypothetical protein
MSNKTKYCNFCARFNQKEATVCVGCGLPLGGVPTKQSVESNDKKSGFRFLLSRIGAVDFLHLHLH